ncbi:MAG: acyl-ACP--UDP-N-acetylglucosamine O-acyltransferase [Alphaproteobacteria bacterium]|nr:acyl-ACP--UDP-N-acetylglucosamine O-acyltransferase [Alphaproteobacteria bacterium]
MEKLRSKQLVDLETLNSRRTFIAKSADVDTSAKIGKNVVIEDFCKIGANVKIGDFATIMRGSIIEENSVIGRECVIHPYVIIGNQSHDLKFADAEKTPVLIGERVIIREYSNIHAGTPLGGNTIVSDDAYIMSHSHIGHDCKVGRGALLSQQTTLGGEVDIGEYAVIGGCSAIHQFCTIGKYAIIGGCSKITQDVIPFAMSDGNPQSLDGLNLLGLKRHDFSAEDVRVIKEVYKTLFIADDLVWEERLAAAQNVYGDSAVAQVIFDFIKNVSRRPLARPKGKFKDQGNV